MAGAEFDHGASCRRATQWRTSDRFLTSNERGYSDWNRLRYGADEMQRAFRCEQRKISFPVYRSVGGDQNQDERTSQMIGRGPRIDHLVCSKIESLVSLIWIRTERYYFATPFAQKLQRKMSESANPDHPCTCGGPQFVLHHRVKHGDPAAEKWARRDG